MTQRAVSHMAIVSEYGVLADYLTVGNAFADAGVIQAQLLKTKRFQFSAAANDLEVTILGSLDGGATYPITVEATFDLAAGATTTKEVTGYYTNLKVQVRPNVAGAHGTLSTKWAGASF